MRYGIISIGIIFVLVSTAQGATIHVPVDQPTIQDGINRAVNGDTVLVAPGTYVENIDFKGKAITVKSSGGAEVTVIDGNQAGSVVTFNHGEGNDSVIQGFTLTNGSGFVWGGTSGGGIWCSGSSPTISQNIISGNNADYGGGIACKDSSPIITGNQIINNTTVLPNAHTGDGGGIKCNNSSAKISDNTIAYNSAEHDGGGVTTDDGSDGTIISKNMIMGNTGSGIACGGSSPRIQDNFISGNTTHQSGGGINCEDASSPMIINNIISENVGDHDGGGIAASNSSPIICCNTITYNTAQIWGGGGISSTQNSNSTATNNILWENEATTGPEIYIGTQNETSTLTISFSDVEGGQGSVYVEPGCTLNWGAGMIDANPLFVDPTIYDFHLPWDSPCKDTGDNAAVIDSYDFDYDFEGDPRIAYGTVDMGADEFYRHLYYTGDATPGGSLEMKFVGLPGSSPVGLWIAFNALDDPIPGAYGDWWLLPPMIGPIPLASIPSNGVYMLPGTLPATPPAPYTLYFQAIMGMPLKLTNLCTMNVE